MNKKVINEKMIISLYNDGYSGPQISKILEYSKWKTYDVLHKNNIKIKSYSEASTKKIVNHNFFDEINSEKTAYFLGFLYADGNITNDGSITLSQAEQDSEIILKFSKLIGKDLPIYTYLSKKDNRQKTYIVSIVDRYMTEKLINWGCFPKKTFTLKFPDFLKNDNLIKHFIRGYFDGDGCLSINKRNRKGRGKNSKNTIVSVKPSYDFSITSTLEFVSEIKKIFKQKFNINCSINKRHKDRDNNNYTLIVGGRKQIQTILYWLYDGASIYLSRKYDKYIKLCNKTF